LEYVKAKFPLSTSRSYIGGL